MDKVHMKAIGYDKLSVEERQRIENEERPHIL